MTPKYANNIIKFPKEKINVLRDKTITKKQADKHITKLKGHIVEEILEIIVPTVYNQLTFLGYPVDDYTRKDGALINETIRSLLYKSHDLSHPLQDLANEMFKIDKNDDLTLSGKLSIITNTAALAVGNN